MTTEPAFHRQLKEKMDDYVHLVYAVTKNFPRDERFGVTSQLRRSALSVILNYIEGYARIGDKMHRHFLVIAYGSLQESKYLLNFSFKEGYLSEADYLKSDHLADEIGAMLWGTLRKL